MPLDPDKLELKFDGCPFGVSARRIHEHMTLAQINPFARSLASVQSPQDAAGLIDLVRFDSAETFSLTGATLAGLDAAVHRAGAPGDELAAARQGAAQATVRAFVGQVAAAVKQHAGRRAARNVPARFLPPPAPAIRSACPCCAAGCASTWPPRRGQRRERPSGSRPCATWRRRDFATRSCNVRG